MAASRRKRRSKAKTESIPLFPFPFFFLISFFFSWISASLNCSTHLLHPLKIAVFSGVLHIRKTQSQSFLSLFFSWISPLTQKHRNHSLAKYIVHHNISYRKQVSDTILTIYETLSLLGLLGQLTTGSIVYFVTSESPKTSGCP